MAKTRMITIRRTTSDEVIDKKGKVTVQKVVHSFPCKINAAVPYNHQMCK